MDTSFYSELDMVGLAIHLVLKANHKDKKILWNKEELLVKRGQFITGRKVLAREFKIPESTLWNKVKILKNVGFIDIKSNNRFSIITIIKYNKYQDDNSKSNSKADNKPPAGYPQADTNNNDKNVLKMKKNRDTLLTGGEQKQPTEAELEQLKTKSPMLYNILQRQERRVKEKQEAKDKK